MTTIPVTAGVILIDKKLFLIKRAKEPRKGYWNIPGGKVDPGETAEQTTKREIFEETGLKVRVKDLCYTDNQPHNEKIYALKAFYCDVAKFAPQPDPNEVLDWKLVSAEEAKQLQLTDHVRDVLIPLLVKEGKLT